MGVYFWIFSAIALVGALRVITHPKPVYAASVFVLTVFASRGLFVLLWAEFMAVALVLIYAGAILVTYVFVIMLAAEATPTSGPMAGLAEHDAISREPLIACAVGFAMMGVLLFVIFERRRDSTAARARKQCHVRRVLKRNDSALCRSLCRWRHSTSKLNLNTRGNPRAGAGTGRVSV
jgi:NADH-quinone oxidoreductase subunit J